VRWSELVEALAAVGYDVLPADGEKPGDQAAAAEPQRVRSVAGAGSTAVETTEPRDDNATTTRKRRGAYKGTLQIWLSSKPLSELHRTVQRAGPSAIAQEFKLHCESEKPEVLLLLPKRLRSMQPMIEGHINARVSAAETVRKSK
jgi:hypothetical protein